MAYHCIGSEKGFVIPNDLCSDFMPHPPGYWLLETNNKMAEKPVLAHPTCVQLPRTLIYVVILKKQKHYGFRAPNQ